MTGELSVPGIGILFLYNCLPCQNFVAELGFNDTANLDEGAMWPVAYVLKELNAAAEKRIVALVKKV